MALVALGCARAVHVSAPPSARSWSPEWGKPAIPDTSEGVAVSGTRVYVVGQRALWRSTDGGLTFLPTTAACSTVAASGDTVYASGCAGDARVSTDGGVTWRALAGSRDVLITAVDPEDARHVYGVFGVPGSCTAEEDEPSRKSTPECAQALARVGRIASSDDGGVTFVDRGKPCVRGPDQLTFASRTMIASCQDRAFASHDRGVTWMRLPDEIVSAAGDGDGRVFGLAQASCILEVSTDGARTFSTMIGLAPDGQCLVNDEIGLAAILPGAPNELLVPTFESTLASHDGGKTFTPIAGVYPAAGWRLEVSSTQLIARTNGTVFERPRELPTVLPSAPIDVPRVTHDWTALPGLTGALSSSGGWLFVNPKSPGNGDRPLPAFSADGGRTWRRAPVCSTMLTVDRADPRTAYLSPCDPGRFAVPLVTHDAGATFTAFVPALGRDIQLADGKALLASGSQPRGGQILVSRDAGASWTRSDLGSGEDLQPWIHVAGDTILRWNVRDLTLSTDAGRTWKSWIFDERASPVAVGSDVYLVDGLCNFRRSTDGGVSWNIVFPAGDCTKHGAAIAADGRAIYVVTDRSLRRSADGGATFQTLGPAGCDPVSAVEIAGGAIYEACTDGAIQRRSLLGAAEK
jgi:photosystem II stability/assembly factor-like uncharacterized protein